MPYTFMLLMILCHYARCHYASTSTHYAQLILWPPGHLVYSDNLTPLPLRLSEDLTTPTSRITLISCHLWNLNIYVPLTTHPLYCNVNSESPGTRPPWWRANSKPLTKHVHHDILSIPILWPSVTPDAWPFPVTRYVVTPRQLEARRGVTPEEKH